MKPFRLNRIKISSVCLSMISRQTLRVCPGYTNAPGLLTRVQTGLSRRQMFGGTWVRLGQHLRQRLAELQFRLLGGPMIFYVLRELDMAEALPDRAPFTGSTAPPA